MISLTAAQQPDIPMSLGQLVSSPTIWIPAISQIPLEIVPVKLFPSVINPVNALSWLRVVGYGPDIPASSKSKDVTFFSLLQVTPDQSQWSPVVSHVGLTEDKDVL